MDTGRHWGKEADPATKEPILPVDDVSVVAFKMTADDTVEFRT